MKAKFTKNKQPAPCRICHKLTVSDKRGPDSGDRCGLCPKCYQRELDWIAKNNSEQSTALEEGKK